MYEWHASCSLMTLWHHHYRLINQIMQNYTQAATAAARVRYRKVKNCCPPPLSRLGTGAVKSANSSRVIRVAADDRGQCLVHFQLEGATIGISGCGLSASLSMVASWGWIRRVSLRVQKEDLYLPKRADLISNCDHTKHFESNSMELPQSKPRHLSDFVAKAAYIMSRAQNFLENRFPLWLASKPILSHIGIIHSDDKLLLIHLSKLR